MAILAVGSIAFDTIKTPFGKKERVLGGSATHFSLAASFFTEARVVGVVGGDFTAENEAVMTKRGVREQMPKAKLVGGDTMNFWIGGKRKELGETLKGIDVLLINDGEAKLLAADASLPRAANKILTMGPKAVVIKHGEYGATLF